jgi:lipoprotein-anchoring transpeptidase ErfK/SrfK
MRADSQLPPSRPTGPTQTTRRLRPPLGALVVFVLALGLGACGGGGGGGDDDTASGGETTSTAEGGGSTTTMPDYVSWVAQARGQHVEVFDQRGAPQPSHVLDNPNENGAPLVFLVEGQDRSGEWLPVNLPIRPNGSTGFVRAGDVTVVENDYRVKVELGAHHLTVTKRGESVLEAPIGVGTQETPTPGGVYYIKELIQPPNPNGDYGAYAYGLSGFSNVLDEFNGGDGVIGIHGTNDPSSIGRDVSHGCIRVTNDVITQMAGYLPLGTPVEIVA